MSSPRPTPVDLVLGDSAGTIFPDIRVALGRSGTEPRNRDAFLMVREVVALLRELRPEEGLGEGIHQLAALVHHFYLFWAAGCPSVELPGEMALVTDGILTQRLPWGLVLIGVFLTIAIELMGLQSLPIAVGVYLPISTSAPMFIGGAVRWLVERRLRSSSRSLAEVESGPGVLFASGLIAGGAIAGVVIAGIAALFVVSAEAAQVPAADYLAHMAKLQRLLGGFATSDIAALVMFALLGGVLYRVARR